MKKLISLLLVLFMVISCVIPAFAVDEAYPESEHNYRNNSYDIRTFTYPGEAEGIFITFSANTRFSPSQRVYVLEGDNVTDEDLAMFAEKGYVETEGDFLAIEYGDGQLYGVFTGSELASKTIYVPSREVKFILISDKTATAYGYKVTKISKDAPSDVAIVNYITEQGTVTTAYKNGAYLQPHNAYRNKVTGNKAIIGWKMKDGTRIYYNNMPDADELYDDDSDYNKNRYHWRYESDVVLEAGRVYELTPIYCPVSVRPEETFSFNNSTHNFERDGLGYVYTDKHFYRQYLNYGVTFALSPVAPLAAVACTAVTAVWPTIDFNGSCCGFPICVLMQKNGKIDLLKSQNVNSVSELKPTEELISILNFYNNQAIPCFVTNNMGIEAGTKDFSRQLKKLYNTVESGKSVYFEYLYGDHHILSDVLKFDFTSIEAAHGVLITGAYTDDKGNHILIGDNNMDATYCDGEPQIWYISPDFSYMYDDFEEELKGFSWSADVNRYDSFKHEGISNPFAWHISFIKNIITNLIELIRDFVKIR